MTDKCPNCGFEVTLSPRERQSLLIECSDRKAHAKGLQMACDSLRAERGVLLEALERIDDCSGGKNPDRWFRTIAHKALTGSDDDRG